MSQVTSKLHWYLMEIGGRTIMTTCAIGSEGDRESWLVSPEFRSPSYKIFIDIEIALKDCSQDPRKCAGRILLFLVDETGRNLNGHKTLRGSRTVGRNAVLTYVFNSFSPTVGLVVVNKLGCVVISKIKIYYKRCEEFRRFRAIFPSALSANSEIGGRCVIGFVPAETSPSYTCNLDGHPERVLGSCVCPAGFALDKSANICTRCRQNYYKDWKGNEGCRRCPPNSHSRDSTKCTCNEGLTQKTLKDGLMYCLNSTRGIPSFNLTVLHDHPGTVSIVIEDPGKWTLLDYKLNCSTNSSRACLIGSSRSPQTLGVVLTKTRVNVTYHLILLVVLKSRSKEIVTATRLTLNLKVGQWLLVLIKHVTMPSFGDLSVPLPEKPRTHRMLRVLVCLEGHTCDEWTSMHVVSASVKLRGMNSGQYTIKVYGLSDSESKSHVKSTQPVVAGCVVFVVLLFLLLFFMRRKLVLCRGSKAGPDNPWYNYPDILLTFEKFWNKSTMSSVYLNIADSCKVHGAETDFKFLRKHLLDRKDLLIEGCLLDGERSCVYRGKYMHDDGVVENVAVKIIKSSEKTHKTAFLREAGILSQLSHRNVTSFVGVVSNGGHNWMVCLFMWNESLDKYLRNRHSQILVGHLVGFLWDVANGMDYLLHLGVIHRDLAARNVLLDEDGRCRISDFGLAHKLEGDAEFAVIKGEKIPVKWTAPECFVDCCFSFYTDVWSYGVFAWEVMSFADKPYFDWSNVRVIRLVSQGYRLPPPVNCPKRIYGLIEHCWNHVPMERPTFAAILSRICEMKSQNIEDEVYNQFVVTSLSDKSLSPEDKPRTVEGFLSTLGMQTFSQIFSSNNVSTIDQLLCLDERDLVCIGIDSLSRAKLMGAIASWTNSDIYYNF